MAGPIAVIAPDGKVGHIPAEKAGDALRQGYRVASPEDVKAAEVRKARSSVGQRTIGTAEAFARGATVGLSDVAGKALGGEEYSQAARERQEAGGTGAQIAEAVGAIAPLVASGGASAPVQAGGRGALMTAARLSPAALVARGAGATGKLAGRLAGTGEAAGTLGRVARGAMPLAVEGAVEGAAVGAGQAVSRAVLDDAPVTAEKVLAGAGEGAMWGSIIGGGMGATATSLKLGGEAINDRFRRLVAGDEKAVGALAGAEAEALEGAVTELTGQAPAKGLRQKASGAIAEAYAEATALATGAPKKTILEFGPLAVGKKADAGRELYKNRDALHGQMTTRITDDLDMVIVTSKAPLDEVVERRLKRSGVEKNIAQGVDHSAAQVAATREMSEMQGALREMVEDSATYGNAEFVRSMNKLADDAQDAVFKSGNPAESYVTLDNIKRSLQKKVMSVRRGMRQISDPLRREQAAALVNRLAPQQEKMRRFLENQDVWGKQGAAQEAVNSAMTRQISAKNAGLKQFTDLTEPDFETGLRGNIANPKKLSSYLKATGTAEGKLADSQFAEYVESTSELTKAIRDNYDLAPDVAKQVEDTSKAVDRIKATLDEMGESTKVINQIDVLMNAQGPGAQYGAAAGGVMGGAAGAAVGAGLQAISNPGGIIRKMMTAQSLLKRAKAFDIAADTAIAASISPSGTLANIKARAAQVAKGVKKKAVPVTVVAASKKRESKRAAYRRTVDSIRRFNSDIDYAGDTLAETTSESAGSAPHVEQGMHATLMRGAQYLESKIPTQPASGGLQPKLRDPYVSDSEVARLENHVRAVKNPLVMLDDLKSGTLTRATVDTVKAVYPRIYQEVQQKAWEKVQDHSDPLPRNQVVQLSLLLDFDGSRSLTPEFIGRRAKEKAAEQAMMQKERAQVKQRSGRKSKTQQLQPTGTVGLEMRRGQST